MYTNALRTYMILSFFHSFFLSFYRRYHARNWLCLLPDALQRGTFGGPLYPRVFIGPANSMSYPLHRNINDADALLSVVSGRKQFAVFPTAMEPFLGRFTEMDKVRWYRVDGLGGGEGGRGAGGEGVDSGDGESESDGHGGVYAGDREGGAGAGESGGGGSASDGAGASDGDGGGDGDGDASGGVRGGLRGGWSGALGPGDLLYMPGEFAHQFRNTETTVSYVSWFGDPADLAVRPVGGIPTDQMLKLLQNAAQRMALLDKAVLRARSAPTRNTAVGGGGDGDGEDGTKGTRGSEDGDGDGVGGGVGAEVEGKWPGSLPFATYKELIAEVMNATEHLDQESGRGGGGGGVGVGWGAWVQRWWYRCRWGWRRYVASLWDDGGGGGGTGTGPPQSNEL